MNIAIYNYTSGRIVNYLSIHKLRKINTDYSATKQGGNLGYVTNMHRFA